ncbi:MAG: acetyl-CoA carboxylase biotin carboxyl carrier protein [Kiritimatiellae bacterium]|jgi:acetyl-CoA carboxylase biotin carboxyl carrier protein|nr:acetyl-CoA carboxylase biotin carboxyl carrier protein [Kiritimatiellia bacterium]
MEYKDLKRIVELVKENGIVEFELQEGDFRLSTKLSHANEVQMVAAPAAAPATAASAAQAPQAAEAAPAVKTPSIKSPMVGSFYRASSPEADPFVKVGDVVTPESTVCIIEAMKVMNEIKAEVKGRITKTLIENGEAVEFGQDLFEIEPL